MVLTREREEGGRLGRREGVVEGPRRRVFGVGGCVGVGLRVGFGGGVRRWVREEVHRE